MKLAKRLRPKHDVPVAAMSDIAFLLIVFFMLTTQMLKEAGLEYQVPAVRRTVDLPETTVTVLIDNKGDVYLNGEPCGLGNLKFELEKILVNLPEAERLVYFKCDQGNKAKTFVPAIGVVSEMGAEVELVTEKETEQDRKKEESQ